MPLEQRRAELMDAALRVIARDGYGAATAEAVAREAGVTKPVLYGAFDNVSELLKQLLDRTQAQALSGMVESLPKVGQVGSDREGAGQVIRAWADQLRADPMTWHLILSNDPATPAAVLERVEEGRATLRRLISRFVMSANPGESKDRAVLRSRAALAAGEDIGRLLLKDPNAIRQTDIVAVVSGLLFAEPNDRSPS